MRGFVAEKERDVRTGEASAGPSSQRDPARDRDVIDERVLDADPPCEDVRVRPNEPKPMVCADLPEVELGVCVEVLDDAVPHTELKTRQADFGATQAATLDLKLSFTREERLGRLQR